MQVSTQNTQAQATTAPATRTSRRQSDYDALPVLGYINLGVMQPRNDEEGEYLLNPFYGIELKEVARRSGLNRDQQDLYAAILEKLATLKEGEATTINLTVELRKPTTEKREADTSRFSL